MAWPTIDPATPLGTDKIKFGDDAIRAAKQHIVDGLTAISNYTAGGSTPAIKTAVWTTATRPAGSDLVDGVTGYNTTLGCEEYYDLTNTKWVTKGMPSWSISGRPSSPIAGQFGYNTDLDVMERYSGSAWVRVSGKPRGMIDMWSGTVADIPTGWVLANGVSQTHPEEDTFSPPDLRNRFIVGAGQDGGTYTPYQDTTGTDTTLGTGYYASGATGGQDTHKQLASEVASHKHSSSSGASFIVNAGGASQYTASGGAWSLLRDSSTANNTGGDGAHENRPPYYALCFLYKL